PRVGDVRNAFVSKDRLPAPGRRNGLRVAKVGVGLRRAVGIAAYGSGFIAFGQRRKDRLGDRRGELDAVSRRGIEKKRLEFRTVLDDATWQLFQKYANRLLLRTAGGGFACAVRAFLLRLREILERPFTIDTRDALRRCLEIEAQRTFDGDLPISEVRRRKHMAHDNVFFDSVLLYSSRVPVLSINEDLQDILR